MAVFGDPGRPQLQDRREGGQTDCISAAIARFSVRVASKLGRGGQNEEQLRAPIEQLFLDIGDCLGLTLVPYGEVRLTEWGVRPDFAIDIGRDRIGYLELKAPETGVPPSWKKDAERNRRQYERMRDLPNLLYTDGTSWQLVRSGQLSGRLVALEGDLAEGDLRPGADNSFHDLVSAFLGWAPTPPRSLSRLIKVIAGPCRVLRASVAEILTIEAEQPGAPVFTRLAEDWRKLLFPRLPDKEFPDAYAQTVTFALLLAREAGISFEDRGLRDIAEQLRKHHPLMGRALHVLAHDDAVQQLRILDTLRIVIGAVDWQALPARDREKYWDLYEPFLSEYDKDLRQRSGSYYTPEPVARFMTGFVDKILQDHLGCDDGFAADDVVAMDPAMGTGTFLVEVIRAAARTSTDAYSQKYAHGVLRDLYRTRLIGFERSAATYVVAELRLHQTLKEVFGVEPPDQSMRFLANTLADPGEPRQQGLEYAEIIESRERADYIKRKTPIVAVIGNPPYVNRARTRDPAPWIEQPRDDRPHDRSDRPAIDDFREPGNGNMEYPLHNTGTYFWRWSTWKVFDAHPGNRAGVVALITTSAYLRGAAFAGMRHYLRQTCDEGWIIDLSPEGQRPDVRTRVFRGVKEPVCIGIFVRKHDNGDQFTPAIVHYTALHGTRNDKLARLSRGIPLGDPGWRTCAGGWTDDFLPDDPAWASHPAVTDLVPWGEAGIKPGLTWVYAPRPDVLQARWARFTAAADREPLFKDPGRPGRTMPPSLSDEEQMPVIEECAFRAFDRQYILADQRLADRLRASLWAIRSPRQVYISVQHDQAIKAGPAVIYTDLVPDQHHFAARGGKVLPLYKHAQAQAWASNIPQSFRRYLAARTQSESITPEDVFAYIAAVAAHPGYTERFWQSLRRPGVRIPLTADPGLWDSACSVGAEIIWLHTFGRRYSDPALGRPERLPRLPSGQQPEIITEILDEPAAMPDEIMYDESNQHLLVGQGIIGPVTKEAWDYQVSGRPVIRQWFSFRSRHRQHQRRTSALDDIRITRWTYHLNRDLLDLLNVLTRLVGLQAQQEELLDAICDGPLITVDDLTSAAILPPPQQARKAPRPARQDELAYDSDAP